MIPLTMLIGLCPRIGPYFDETILLIVGNLEGIANLFQKTLRAYLLF